MQPNNGASNVTLDLDPSQVDFGERKAYVNLQPNLKDMQLWEAMDKASDDLAIAFANGHKVDFLHPVSGMDVQLGADAVTMVTVIPHVGRDQHPNGRRDPLGSTHHEAGTLRMGDNPTTSVTDANCRFRGVKERICGGSGAISDYRLAEPNADRHRARATARRPSAAAAAGCPL